MHRLSTLPTTAEQARHALLLIGAPAGARLVVDVHSAFFDGDLSVPALAGLRRDRHSGLCAALNTDLTPVRGLVALAEWSLERRIVTPARQRVDALTAAIRVAEFVAMQPGAGRSAHRLLQSLTLDLADGPVPDLAEAQRVAALDAPALAAALARAEALPVEQQLTGLPAVPHQRGRE